MCYSVLSSYSVLVVLPPDVFFPADSLSSSLHRDDHRVRVVVCVADLQVFKEVRGSSTLRCTVRASFNHLEV